MFLLFSVVVTVAMAVAFHVWQRRGEDRRWESLRLWAHSVGWRVCSGSAATVLPASWPEFPPARGTPLITLVGERDGYPLVLEWTCDGESLATVCYATLGRDHRLLRLRRRLFARRLAPEDRYDASGSLSPATRDALGAASADFWQLSGRHLAAVHRAWLEPGQIRALVREVTAMATAVDGTGTPSSTSPKAG